MISIHMCQDLFVFFFQAEDGIRDVAVTGVQTCALPISLLLREVITRYDPAIGDHDLETRPFRFAYGPCDAERSEEHTSELQSRLHLVCRLLLEKKKTKKITSNYA